jgi:hypothetical protein
MSFRSGGEIEDVSQLSFHPNFLYLHAYFLDIFLLPERGRRMEFQQMEVSRYSGVRLSTSLLPDVYA